MKPGSQRQAKILPGDVHHLRRGHRPTFSTSDLEEGPEVRAAGSFPQDCPSGALSGEGAVLSDLSGTSNAQRKLLGTAQVKVKGPGASPNLFAVLPYAAWGRPELNSNQ